MKAEIRKVGDESWQALPLANQKGMAGHIKRRDAWNFIKSDNSVTNTADYAGRIEEATNNAFIVYFALTILKRLAMKSVCDAVRKMGKPAPCQ